jgi:dTDP-4-dehydrorhamnose reductase
MKILVTGGAGFIGSHYVRTLLTGGYPGFDDASVTVLDKLTYAGNLDNLEPVSASPKFEFVSGDICDASLLRSVLPGHDAVINFAAETHVDRSITGAAEFATTNMVGVQVLMEACLGEGVSRVVQVSTDEVYGSIASGSWTESSPLDPNSPYAAAKAGGDLMARAYARTHGLNVSITRCCNNYGPYQYPEKVIPLFVTNLTFTCGMVGAQALPCPNSAEPRAITTNCARFCLARSKTVSSRSPAPLSMTIALTRAGIPRSGQMKKRAVAILKETISTTSTMASSRRDFLCCFDLDAVGPDGREALSAR